MAEVPVDPLGIIERFGPHLSEMTGVRLSTSVEPDRLVKTHCCFCGQQCGIQLKVRDNEVIGFEPWEEFPFNRGMASLVSRVLLNDTFVATTESVVLWSASSWT